LVSRSGKVKDYKGQDLQDRLATFLEPCNGTAVSVECCDASGKVAVQTLLAFVREKHGKIDTVIHASGVLYDGLLQQLDLTDIRESFGPKAAGAWYLHKHTLEDDVCNFVVFSSIAAQTDKFQISQIILACTICHN